MRGPPKVPMRPSLTGDGRLNQSMGEVSTLPKSRTMDEKDPWAGGGGPVGGTMRGPPKVPMRPSLTGDGRLNQSMGEVSTLPKSRTMDEKDPWAGGGGPVGGTMRGPPKVPMRPSLTGDGRLNQSMGEVSTLPKSRTMDEKDPWAGGGGPVGGTMRGPPKVPMRPSLTGDGRLNQSMGEVSTLPKSRTMDEKDPWAGGGGPVGGTMRGPPKVPMRPSLTGDGRLNQSMERGTSLEPVHEEMSHQDLNELFGGESGVAWPMAPSLTGSSSRPRPRANTPTNCFSLTQGVGSFSRSSSMASLGDESLGGSQYFADSAAKIPVAMALTETVHAKFTGTDPSKGQVRVFGSVHVSFPGSAMGTLLSDSPPPALTFRLSNAGRLQALIPNKQVLASGSAFASAPSHDLAFDPQGLAAQLSRLTAQRPGAPFYNLEVLRYEVRTPAVPVLLAEWWKAAEGGGGDLRIDWSLNPANPFSKALLNPTFALRFAQGTADAVTAVPEGELVNSGSELRWRLTTLSSLSEETSKGSLKARLTVAPGSPALSPSPASLSFSVADASLSGAALDVAHDHYRLSLLKRKIVAGKYTVEKAPL